MNIRSLTFACLCVGALLASGGVRAEHPPAAVTPRFDDTWLEGTIGKNLHVRMYVGAAGFPERDGLWGAYFYTSQWTLIPLEGPDPSSATVVLHEGNPILDEAARPRLELNFASRPRVTGTWTSADGARVLAVRLRVISQPPSYDRAITHPRVFNDPRWPIAFEYPDGWSLQLSDTTLRLQSPDPEDMLFENRLECERGRGLPAPPRPKAPPVMFRWPYYRTSGGWVVSPDNFVACDDPEQQRSCAAPEARSSARSVLMQTDTGIRVYSPFGYGGAGDSEAYLAIAGQEWAQCADRLLPPGSIRLR